MAVVMATEYGYISILKSQKTNLKAEVENLNEKLKITKASVSKLQDSISEQNTAIDKFKKSADENAEKNKPKIDAANTTAAELNRQASAILSKPQLKETTACAAANELINSEIGNAK